MPEPLLYHPGVDPGTERERGPRVAKAMKWDAGERPSLDPPIKLSGHALRVEGFAGHLGEHQPVIAVARTESEAFLYPGTRLCPTPLVTTESGGAARQPGGPRIAPGPGWGRTPPPHPWGPWEAAARYGAISRDLFEIVRNRP